MVVHLYKVRGNLPVTAAATQLPQTLVQICPQDFLWYHRC